MSIAHIIREVERLPVSIRLLVVERTLKSIQLEGEKNLNFAVEQLYNDYATDKELTVFTQLDAQNFYEAR